MPRLQEQDSIPVERSTDAATGQAHSDMFYRGSSLCSSASSSPVFSTTTSESSLLDQQPVKYQLCPSRGIPQCDKNNNNQQTPASTRNDNNSATSSPGVSSSDRSTNKLSEIESHDDNDHYNNNKTINTMLSVDNISNSSSNSSIGSFSLSIGDEAPVLPPRSARRVSRLMTPIPPKKTASSERPMLPHAAPHQMYLSSEEDASSSADDFSDFAEEPESDSENSHKDTARMVSVKFYGKPSIVTMPSRRSISPSSSSSRPTGPAILRTLTEPALSRPRSISSTCSLTPTFHHPPRSSSMMTASFAKKRPGFLQIDPYAKGNEDLPEIASARTPKTPTAMFRKTLNLVKKRSKQNLQPSESHISHMEQVGEVEEEHDPRQSMCMGSSTASSVSYQDIMRNAKRNTFHPISRSEVSTPKSPKHRFRSGLSLTRQRSVRA
ncbi:hypothetical protein E4U22_006093 [Claviceps purpurea]|nr:hypothetical protein E4U37_000864 [Claviceps purpurea]KAG6161526.1 hypothetical protein E4U51_007060 [Claviceps purpurea]KAG6185852.1 hypothetical protein E4U27_000280 [Claviceps purpurea]KAG6254580.1 hypothetical protein E4U24_007458 [Claviceps purpurea]KAG6324985.1 hypothetical protein E4U22_006093 [Claviceps purpurea]